MIGNIFPPSTKPAIEGRVPTKWMFDHRHDFTTEEFYDQSLTEIDLRRMLTSRKLTGIDWTADVWFGRYHAEDLTQEFKEWWVDYYGAPSDYEDSYSEQDEYWKRCGFCLIGWCAAKTPNGHAHRPEPAR